MGKDEKFLIESSRRMNRPVIARIQNAPDLIPGLELFQEAFDRLTTSRLLTQGAIGPIPYAAISGYCKDEGIVGETREDLFYHVERMDAAYIKWQTNRAKYEEEVAKAARGG